MSALLIVVVVVTCELVVCWQDAEEIALGDLLCAKEH